MGWAHAASDEAHRVVKMLGVGAATPVECSSRQGGGQGAPSGASQAAEEAIPGVDLMGRFSM